MKDFLINSLKKGLKLFVPSICLKCQTIDQTDGFCFECWKELIFLTTPCCDQCAQPLVEDGLCLRCQYTKPFYDKTRSLFVYNAAIKPLILALKYNNAEYCGKILGQMMGYKIYQESQSYDYIVPVPLHWKRFFKRGYNQSVVLSKGISKICGLPINLDLLYRKTKEEHTQAGATAILRHKNVEKAFGLKPSAIKGKKIIVVDDVLATSATVNACCKILKAQGVAEIMVVTLAKSLK